MTTISKKFVSVALTATTAVWMSGAMMLVPVAHAQTTADLQAQIAALLAQIQQLQAKLSGGSSMSTSYTRDLTVGSRGDDVSSLQQTLISKGYLKISAPTGYFGPLTRTALAAWQAARGVSPAAGYFGPKTRAAFGASVATGPVTPGSPTPPPVVAPATGLAVSVAADNAAAGSLISSSGSAAARIPVLTVNLTAGSSGSVTVTDLKFTKGGVLSDSAISSAYLIENGKVLTQFSSLSGGVITFTGLGWAIAAGATKHVTLAIDPSTGLSAGNTVSFMIKSASDVIAVDSANTAIVASGTFPATGNIFTVTTVSNPSIASLTMTSSSVGTSVYAGTQAVLASQWTLSGTNSPMDLKGINFKVVGSATKSDIKNIKLFVNGTQVGPTLGQVAADGSAYFDLSAAPARLNTGSGNMQVYADIMGSPSYNFQFELLNSYDVLSVDTQYGVPVTVTITGGAGTLVSILQGSLTVSLDTNTPTGNIAKGGSGTPIARFKIYAAGEPVKVKFLTFRLDFTGTTTTLSSMVKNITLVDDAGNQVGSTVNTPPSTASCDVSGTATTAGYNGAGTQYTDCFGTSSSNINYTIPANTTRLLTLRADVQTGAGFTTIVGNLVASTNNLSGQTSSQIASSAGVAGSSLTLVANSLTVSQNSAVGTQTYAKAATGVVIGSYSLLASSAEGANLNSITILTSASSTNFQNLKLCTGRVSGGPTCPTQIGITQSTLSASASYAFSGNVNIPAGQARTFDVIADILSGTAAASYTAVTTLSGCSGSGAVTYTSITCSSQAGQNVVVAGQATVTVSYVSGAAPATQLVMGSNGNTLGIYRVRETSNIEDVKITDVFVFQNVASTTTIKAGFNGLTLSGNGTNGKGAYSYSSFVQSPSTSAAVTASSTGYIYHFSFATPVVVPASDEVILTLKGNAASYSTSGASDNTTSIFKIATSSVDSAIATPGLVVVAYGNTSNATTSISFSTGATAPVGNAQTLLRSKLTVSSAALGTTSGRAKSTSDNLGTLTFAADNAGSVAVNSVTITFAGSAPSNGSFLDGVNLIDEGGASLETLTGATVVTSTACTSVQTSTTATCSKTFMFGGGTAGQGVSPSTPRVWTLRANTNNTFAAASGISATLSAYINVLTDVRFTDALDTAATSQIGLPSNVTVPINITSVTYAAGT